MHVLISHAVEDEPAAAALKEMIRRCSLNTIDVWFSSDRATLGGMPIGGPWFSELNSKLKETQWIVAIVTPQSVSSPWLYFECGFVACTRSQGVIPLTLGVPTSNVPMPLAAYQIYDLANAASLATFVQKLLEADNILYDEEMTLGVRESTQRRMIEHQNKIQAGARSAAAAEGNDLSQLKAFIDQRFFELYEMLPTSPKGLPPVEMTVDLSEVIPGSIPFILNLPAGSSVIDVLNELYFRIHEHVLPFTYLVEWMITDTKDGSDLSLQEVARRVPAHLIFASGRKYKVRLLSGGDEYVRDALDRSKHRTKGG